MMELGATGRGEHMLIGTYVESTVDSELSGNMIDLCPVGALTSKPFRYTARSWELDQSPSVSPHDCVGANLTVETRRGRVMRVLPRENEAVNEVWISDRDRFSYTALYTAERLRTPMIRNAEGWQETDWQTALACAAAGLLAVVNGHGPHALGALASPQLTLEEGFLLQRLVRGLGSENIDHRLREVDFRDDAAAPLFPGLGHTIVDLESRDAVLLIGSNIRKDQPLLGHRLRKAFLDGARIAVINPLDFAFTFDTETRVVVPPAQMPTHLAMVALAVATRLRVEPPPDLLRYAAELTPGQDEQAIAALLCGAKRPSILLGPLALSHPHAADLRALAAFVASATRARLGYLPYGSAASAWLAGVVPHRGPLGVVRPVAGRPASAMLGGALKGFLLVDAEPCRDSSHGQQARTALQSAECVVVMSAFQTEARDYAHVLLPMTPFTETDGTFVNGEGRWQSFVAAAPPLGDARPGWKILRVLAGLLGVHDCEFDSTQQIQAELGCKSAVPQAAYGPWLFPAPRHRGYSLERIASVSLYDSDSLVRRAPPLQATTDRTMPAAYMNAAQAQRLGLAIGNLVAVTMGSATASLEVRADPRVPDGAVFIPAALPETANLPLSGAVTLVRA